MEDASGIRILDRRTGTEHHLSAPIEPVIRTRTSPVRLLAVPASAVLALYLSSILASGLVSHDWQAALLLLAMAIPFVVGRASSGKLAVLAYLVAFMALGYFLGILESGTRLGVIFFGGGPGTARSYDVVPASNLLPVALVGLLPYVSAGMLGEVLVSFDVTLKSPSGDYTLVLRHKGMAKEAVAFVSRGDRGQAR